MADDFAEAAARLHPMIAARRSGRLLDPAGLVGRDQVTTLLEAARWAPTWGKRQPVRFIVGLRGPDGPDETFGKLRGLLSRGNQSWAPAAGALVLFAATAAGDPDEIAYAPVDLGLALGQFILQAVADGLVAHPMAGFDKAVAKAVFGFPAGFEPWAVVAVGFDGAGLAGADPGLVAKENAPRKRLPLSDVAFAGKWGERF
ncbi:MAG: nitroreductase family protein [Segniliparus sp.]|uniref:nitroreductase family protein n=1 Tax=Segniliparus sp. TaxID=2804064 RepID=UPI003F3BE248